MEGTSSELNRSPISTPRRPPRRLLFDRRYGWIFDEWKDPSEEALAGGRGMFCILPIAKSLLTVVSLSMNIAADYIVRSVRTPNQLSLQTLCTSLQTCMRKLLHSTQGMNLKLMSLGRDYAMFKRPSDANSGLGS